MVVSRQSGLRSFDAFAKPMDGVRNRTMTGGIITLLASTAAGVLFLSQLYLYIRPDIRHSLTLSKSLPTSVVRLPELHALHGGGGGGRSDLTAALSREAQKTRVLVSLHVTFAHLPCTSLDYGIDGALLSTGAFQKTFGRSGFSLQRPTEAELRRTLGVIRGRLPNNFDRSKACTIRGSVSVPMVGGSISLSVSRNTWSALAEKAAVLGLFDTTPGSEVKHDTSNFFNVSHYIHEIKFGTHFPLSENPLKDASHMIDNDSGIGLNNIVVKLVPTLYKRAMDWSRETYQVSVSSHMVHPQTLTQQRTSMLPGMVLSYDFSPLAVHHVESRENIAAFLGSLVGIVGGVFVTVQLVSGCLVQSASVVAKKMD